MNENLPEPLPRDWLPEPTGPVHDVRREERLRNLMAAAEPRLAQLRPGAARWWQVLGGWWRPAAGLVGLTAVAFAVVLRATPPGPADGALTLGAVVSDGDPAALWAALGSETDPVLAVIALEGGTP